MIKLQEDTEFYAGHLNLMGSYAVPGMILIEVHTKEKDTGRQDSAGIRLAHEQAKELGLALITMAAEFSAKEKMNEKV